MKKENIKEIIRAAKFAVISVSAGIIQVLSFTLMFEVLELDYWASYLTSLILSIIWNFTINRKITFKSAGNVKIAMLLVLAFYAVFTPVSTVLGSWAESTGANESIVLALTMISNLVLEFLDTRYVVYRNSCDTMEEKKKDSADKS